MTEGLLTSETPEEKAYFEQKGVVETPDAAEKPAEQEAPAEAEKSAEADKEPEQAKEPDLRTVPYVALKEERQKRQKEREERAKLEGRLAVIEEEWRRSNQPAAEKPKDLDPLAKLERLEKAERERVEADQRENQRRGLISQYQASAQEYEKEQPDFRDAYAHLVSHRVQELMAIGHDAATAQQIAADNETAIVAMAIQQGANPAERVYNLAKMRGYTPKSKTSPQEQKPAAQEKLATVEKGQLASKSLSQAPGAAAKTGSLQALAEMSDEEFDAATKGRKWADLWK